MSSFNIGLGFLWLKSVVLRLPRYRSQ